jgi:hypothetical protein
VCDDVTRGGLCAWSWTRSWGHGAVGAARQGRADHDERVLVDVWRGVGRQFRLVGCSCWCQAGGPKQHGELDLGWKWMMSVTFSRTHNINFDLVFSHEIFIFLREINSK